MNEGEKEYFAISLDPIHIGTGGYRLGRVDLSIVRDPVTNVPKIPATSLTGPARAFTALRRRRYRWQKGDVDNIKEYSCAGKGGEGGEKHCGESSPACPVCIPYGFSKKDFSFQGLAQFFDAHILFYPVTTMIGPVWITSPLTLEFINEGKFTVSDDRFYPLGEINRKRLNFGYLLLEKDEDGKGELKDFPSVPQYIKDRSVLIPDNLFSKIVNSNLEVRTSVSIDPATGAAEEGALFSYEAIPRGTVFKFEIIYNDPQNFRINGKQIEINDPNSSNKKIPASITWVKNQVEEGLKLFETLGIGGMNTRGMGRIKILNIGGNNGKK